MRKHSVPHTKAEYRISFLAISRDIFQQISTGQSSEYPARNDSKGGRKVNVILLKYTYKPAPLKQKMIATVVA